MCCDEIDQSSNCTSNCNLRLQFSVQPYKATAPVEELMKMQRPIQGDNITEFEEGPKVFDTICHANPFTLELTTWTVSNDCTYS